MVSCTKSNRDDIASLPLLPLLKSGRYVRTRNLFAFTPRTIQAQSDGGANAVKLDLVLLRHKPTPIPISSQCQQPHCLDWIWRGTDAPELHVPDHLPTICDEDVAGHYVGKGPVVEMVEPGVKRTVGDACTELSFGEGGQPGILKKGSRYLQAHLGGRGGSWTPG